MTTSPSAASRTSPEPDPAPAAGPRRGRGRALLRSLGWLLVLGLLLPAAALTGARLSTSESGGVVRLQSFTPLALPACALALVVLILLLGGQARRGWLAASPEIVGAGLALFGVVVHAWWFAPQVLGDNPPPKAGATPIVVMTSNLYEGRGDAAQLVTQATRAHADILVVEEITPTAASALDRAGIAAVLPYHAGAAAEGVPGTMVFADRPIDRAVREPTVNGSYLVRVDSLTLLAVHTVAPTSPDLWAADHRTILAVAEREHPDLIVGDFNATPDHAVMRRLDDAGYRDAAELANEGWQPTWPANHIGYLPWLPPVVRIDHVLVASTYAALGTHTVRIDGTDHLALVAEVAAR